MARIRYDMNLMKTIALFESISRAQVKDALEDNGTIIFIMAENQIAKAIGKRGSTVKKLELLIKKKVKIVEYSDNVKDFIRNYIAPIEPSEITDDNGMLTIVGKDSRSKSMLIGREHKNLNLLKSIVSRYFEFKDIRVA